MPEKKTEKIIAIIGPTASGKTGLAKALYKKYHGRVISVDSRQIYRRLDLGTGKEKSFPQEMIDIKEPGESFSVVEFQGQVLKLIEEIFKAGKIPFLVGGTGFYLDSIIFERQYPKVEPHEKLRKKLDRLSIPDLYKRLKQKDPASAKRIGRHKRRLIRALEIVEKSGQPVPGIGGQNLRHPTLLLGIEVERERLYQRIDGRVDERIRQGMIKEVRDLVRNGISKDWLRNLGLEYRYIIDYLDLKYTKAEMIEKLKFAIHKFARRQITWFRRYPEIIWLKLEDYSERSKQDLIKQADREIGKFLN
jgi:tRNA dimethylallyltransferase